MSEADQKRLKMFLSFISSQEWEYNFERSLKIKKIQINSEIKGILEIFSHVEDLTFYKECRGISYLSFSENFSNSKNDCSDYDLELVFLSDEDLVDFINMHNLKVYCDKSLIEYEISLLDQHKKALQDLKEIVIEKRNS
jgi:hypothetical protein